MKNVKTLQETFYDDGSYVALVQVYGFEFSVSRNNGPTSEIQVFGTGPKNRNFTGPSWQLKGAVKAAKDFCEQRTALT